MMQITIKRKILIVLGIWFICMIPFGILMLRKVDQLGHSIDVIMRENYRSVIICQQVISSLSQLDGAIFYQHSDGKVDADFYRKEREEIKRLWKEEIANVTIIQEKKLAEKITEQLYAFLQLHNEILQVKNVQTRMERYKKEAIPLSISLKEEINDILTINQNRMYQADQIARKEAENLFRAGIILFITCFLFLGLLGWLLTIWIQKPLSQLLAMSDAIAGGNFSCIVQSGSNDEIGQLMRSFNEMAAFLRSNMTSMEDKIRYSEQITHDMLMTLPIPIVLFSKNEGKMLFATDVAKNFIAVKPDENILEHGEPWLIQLFKRVQQSGASESSNELLNRKEDKMDVSFQVHATPLPTGAAPEEQTAVIFYLQDVSSTLKQQEFEYRILAGFSAYFKELIQDVLLANYVLLNEQCGALNEKQQELLIAVRDNSRKIADGISQITNFPLNHNGLGKRTQSQYIPKIMLLEAVEHFKPIAAHSEISISAECDPELPSVQMSKEQLNKILELLFDNALRFTPAGGIIQFAARKWEKFIEFSVADSGPGIPDELKEKVFEPFFKEKEADEDHQGLGLCMVKSIVLSLGGSIGIRDRDGGGTVVYFMIPEQEDVKANLNSNLNEESLC